MKKIIYPILVSATVVMASNSSVKQVEVTESNSKNSISVDVGTWYMIWNQTSTSKDMLQNPDDTVHTNYNIKNSIAATIALRATYGALSWIVEYSGTPSSKSSDSISSLNVGMSLLNYIPYIGVEARYVKSNFKGEFSASGIDYTDTYGTSFETKVDIADIIIYPANDYVGIGYRTYKYEFPQDGYLTNNSTKSVLLKGVYDLAYKGNFYTFVVDNKKIVEKENQYNGFIYSLIVGMGNLTPNAVGASYSTENAKAIDDHLGSNDALFYDVKLGYTYKSKDNNGFGYGLTTGYKYNKIGVDKSSDAKFDGYSLRTKFNTEFHGPFFDLSIHY